jgi:hypothetical protein
MPSPTGTGFFVSPDGLFVTARHVVTNRDGSLRDDVSAAWLQKEFGPGRPPVMCRSVALVFEDDPSDIAVLRVDFASNVNMDWLAGRDGFPFICVSRRPLHEAEDVYAFGYPLSDSTFERQQGFALGTYTLRPRVTSAIVASTVEEFGPVRTGADPDWYVLDKALNYGNSGGPIVAVETGCAHAICSKFQPVSIPQPQFADERGRVPVIRIPSLYGVVSSLGNRRVRNFLDDERAPVCDG